MRRLNVPYIHLEAEHGDTIAVEVNKTSEDELEVCLILTDADETMPHRNIVQTVYRISGLSDKKNNRIELSFQGIKAENIARINIGKELKRAAKRLKKR